MSWFRYRMEIWLFHNRIRITSGRTDQTIERRADRPFSTDRLLVADIDALSAVLKSAIMELEGKRRWLAWPVAVVHPMEPGEGGLSSVEKLALRQVMEAQGFSKTEIVA